MVDERGKHSKGAGVSVLWLRELSEVLVPFCGLVVDGK